LKKIMVGKVNNSSFKKIINLVILVFGVICLF